MTADIPVDIPNGAKTETLWADTVFTAEDPYQFMPHPGEMDLYLFSRGEHERVWEFMGAHECDMGGVHGVDGPSDPADPWPGRTQPSLRWRQ